MSTHKCNHCSQHSTKAADCATPFPELIPTLHSTKYGYGNINVNGPSHVQYCSNNSNTNTNANKYWRKEVCWFSKYLVHSQKMIFSINCQWCISPHAVWSNTNKPVHKIAGLRNFISADLWENILYWHFKVMWYFHTRGQAVKEEFLNCLTPKKQALHCLKLLWSTQPTTWHHTAEDLNHQQHGCKNLKYHIKFVHFRKESLGKCQCLS